MRKWYCEEYNEYKVQYNSEFTLHQFLSEFPIYWGNLCRSLFRFLSDAFTITHHWVKNVMDPKTHESTTNLYYALITFNSIKKPIENKNNDTHTI